MQVVSPAQLGQVAELGLTAVETPVRADVMELLGTLGRIALRHSPPSEDLLNVGDLWLLLSVVIPSLSLSFSLSLFLSLTLSLFLSPSLSFSLSLSLCLSFAAGDWLCTQRLHSQRQQSVGGLSGTGLCIRYLWRRQLPSVHLPLCRPHTCAQDYHVHVQSSSECHWVYTT